ncbi:MAG: hypothetical protein GXO09_02150 [Crenarchaeota archaeon]|nr:hypothetical protein [Thermoproteota archaeon]
MAKLTLAAVTLTACGGCDVQIMRALLHPDIMESFEIVYWPFAVEETRLPEKVDVALVNGVVRTEEDLEKLREVRKAARRLIVVGSCAGFSGIAGQADYWPTDASLRAVYGKPPENTVKVLRRVFSPADLVPVDYIVSRCPPLVPSIVSALRAVLGKTSIETVESTVCSQCPRRIKEIKEIHFKKGMPRDADPETCFLSQGYLCMGSVTLVGCGAPCTRFGLPCFGCSGPSHEVALRRDSDIVIALARKIAVLAGLDPVEGAETVKKKLLETYGPRRFYVFTMGSEVIRTKPNAYAVEAAAETRLNPELCEKMIETRKKYLRR